MSKQLSQFTTTPLTLKLHIIPPINHILKHGVNLPKTIVVLIIKELFAKVIKTSNYFFMIELKL